MRPNGLGNYDNSPIPGLDARDALTKLGFPTWSTREQTYFPGLWIPMHSPIGEKLPGQWKPRNPVAGRDGKKVKYATVRGEGGMRLDVHPRWTRDRGQVDPTKLPAIQDPAVPLWITEGIKKADALTSRDACTVGLLGVFNWRNANGPLGDWEHVRIKGREVYVCFDADAKTKPQVAKAMARLGKWLKDSKGAAKVLYVLPPVIAPGVKGVDDYFAAGGTLTALEREARTTPPRVVSTDADFTDARLVDTLADDLLSGQHIWTRGLGWMAWDGQRWTDTSDESVADAVRRHALTEHADAAVQMRDGVESAAASVEGWRGVLSATRLRNVTSLLRGAVEVRTDAFDADPEHVNTPSGYLDLEAGEVRPVGEDEYPTKVTGARFEREARSAVWDAFLERILPDAEVRGFVQRLLGYSLLGEVREHVMPIFTGEGANGKGTLRDAVMKAFGDYAIEVDPELLMASHNPRHLTFLMELRGRRLVFCSETEKGRKFAESTMKRLVGGDPIQANRMHKDPITFDPSHTLIMCTNHLPQVSGDDPAVWRRILVVPFDVVIPEDERDGRLPRRLMEPDVQAAVLAWVYEGFQAYAKEGLNPPDAVRVRTDAYKNESDLIGRFLAERVEESPASRTTAKELHTAYVEWMRLEGGKDAVPLGNRELGKDLKRRGWEPVKSGGVMVYRGMHLAPEDA
ncbi:phage/plasmid primase, P4 family [Micromonospora coerulea]